MMTPAEKATQQAKLDEIKVNAPKYLTSHVAWDKGDYLRLRHKTFTNREIQEIWDRECGKWWDGWIEVMKIEGGVSIALKTTRKIVRYLNASDDNADATLHEMERFATRHHYHYTIEYR